MSLVHSSRNPSVLCRGCAAAVVVPSPWQYPRTQNFQAPLDSYARREVWVTAEEDEADPVGEALVAVVDCTLTAARGLGAHLSSGSRKGKVLLQEAARHLRRFFRLRSRKR
jgi:hypothetical protein